MHLQPANLTGPSSFSTASTFGRVEGRGCPGTVCNKAAAAGVYSPGCWTKKQAGGTSLKCLSSEPVSGQGSLIAPFRGGHPSVSKCSNKLVTSPLAMKGGACGTCTSGPPFSGGRRRYRKRRSRRTRRTRRSRRTRRTRRSRRSRRTRHRGGSTKGQGYSNVPLSYGYSLGAPLTSADSALATPPPQHAYNHCQSGAKLISK